MPVQSQGAVNAIYAALYFTRWRKDEIREILLRSGVSSFHATLAEEWARENSFNVRGQVGDGNG